MKITLDRTFIYVGKFYGPGEVEVPDEVGKALAERMQALRPVEDSASEAQEPVPTEDPLAEFPALAAAGYDLERTRAAGDDELLGLPGIGAATLKRIREALA